MADTVYFGARIDGQFQADRYGAPSSYDAPWSGRIAGAGWDLFEQHAGKKVSAIHWGGPGDTLPSSFPADVAQICRDRGAFSAYTIGASVAELADLAAGSDANGVLTKVDTWAGEVAAMGHPILARFCHEMNGDWGYPWQVASGTSQATYIAAWRTFHDRVAALAPNVSFFWCPNVKNSTVPDPTPWFPGAAYVDWVGFDGYNHGSDGSPATIFGETLDIVTGLAPGLPVGIGETGCEAPADYPGGKAQWITDFFAWLAESPVVRYFSWFNETGSPVWPHIEVGNDATTFDGEALASFRAGVAGSRYLANVAGSFPSGAKLPVPPTEARRPLPLTYTVGKNGRTITVSWQPVSGAVGYAFTVDGTRVSHTMAGSRSSVRFGVQDGEHAYGVTALMPGEQGTLVYPPSASR